MSYLWKSDICIPKLGSTNLLSLGTLDMSLPFMATQMMIPSETVRADLSKNTKCDKEDLFMSLVEAVNINKFL